MTNQTDTRALVEQLVEVAQSVQGIISNCNLESGVCCCGDSIEHHPNPMHCGHSPVDSGVYAANSLLEKASSILTAADEYLKRPMVETCPTCGTHEVELVRVCHNSRCADYAEEKTVYEGWKVHPQATEPAPINKKL